MLWVNQSQMNGAWQTQLRSSDAGMLDHIRVEAYGEKMPLHTLATVLARDAQLLVASVYDPAVRLKTLSSIALPDKASRPAVVDSC